jgi:hypothetical protein
MVRKKRLKEKKIWRLMFKNYLEDKENVLFVIHKHPILHGKLFGQAIFFGLFIPFGVWFLFPQTLLFAIIWGAIGIVRIFSELMLWYYEAWLITNTSIVDVDQKSMFERSSTRLEYHHIETITYEIKGVAATLLNYGDVIIEKTTGNNLKFKGAWRPKKVVKELNGFQENFSEKRTFSDHATLKNLLSDMLHTHVKKEGLAKTSMQEIPEPEEA